MDRKSASALLAFACLLMVATVIGCGSVPGLNWGGGGGGSFGPAKFAFVVSSQADTNISGLTISAYSVDSASGALTPVSGSPFLTDASGCCGTIFMDVDPAGRFVFVPNRGAATVSVFAIGTTGALTEISGSPFSTGGSDLYEAEVHPNGRFLYVSDAGNSTILAFSIAADGALTSLGSAPAAFDPRHLFMDPKGRFLYSSDQGEGGVVDGFAIKSDGTLTPISGTPFGSFNCPRSGRVDDSGKFLLVADRCTDLVHVFSIDQTTGGLTEVLNDGSPGFPSGDGAFGVLEFPIGSITYVAVNGKNDGSISVYTFDTTTGKLTPVSGSPFTSLGLSSPHWMALASSTLAYAVDQSNENIVGMTLDANGKPTAIPGSPFSGGGIVTPSQIVFSH